VAEDFARKAGIKIEHVPYKGASQGLTDLAGGHIVFSAQTLSSTAGLVRGGQLRAIAHSHSSRLPDFPEVPTLKESGYDVVATTWFSISGPASLPKDITDKVNREIARAVSNPEAQARLQRDGLIAHIMSVEELSKYIDAETARWRPVLDQLGLIGK
jgi:tripartite-type tricarboxylate transporter receptor subunit TctC